MISILFTIIAALMLDEGSPKVVDISAKKYEYTPAVVTLRKDETVTLRLTTTDRPHGLLVKPLGIDLDTAPGKPATITITPHEAGRFTAICDHYCGAGHGGMKMTFVVE